MIAFKLNSLFFSINELSFQKTAFTVSMYDKSMSVNCDVMEEGFFVIHNETF